MSEKSQIIATLREEFDQWEALLSGLSEQQVNAPDLPEGWSIKDVMAHLWAWQQRSIARMEAAVHAAEPVFPAWPADLDPEVEEEPDQLNDWLFETHREKPWPRVYKDWREGFLHLLDLAEAVPEKDLLEKGRYGWLEDHPLALILTASGEHHQEHRDWLLEFLRRDEP